MDQRSLKGEARDNVSGFYVLMITYGEPPSIAWKTGCIARPFVDARIM